MGIPVKLEVFEGPLDLLLHLIEKNKVDIYDIPIVEITNQYMEYIRQMQREDLNVMSEFLVMAATLLDIKCKMLLPKEVKEDGEEEDPRQELVEQLLQYTMVQLKKVFQEVMRRQTDKVDPVRSKFGKIEKEEVSLTDKFLYVRDYLQEHRRFSFRQLLQKQKSKMHVVVTFLAILEMMKLGEIYVEQESTCGEIMIERKGDVV